MSKKGYISEFKLIPNFIEDNATDEAVVDCYNEIKKLIRKGKHNNDCTLREGINRRTS